MDNNVNTHYVFALYNKVVNGDKKAEDKLIEYYFNKYPINYYEVVDLDTKNIEEMYLTLYND